MCQQSLCLYGGVVYPSESSECWSGCVYARWSGEQPGGLAARVLVTQGCHGVVAACCHTKQSKSLSSGPIDVCRCSLRRHSQHSSHSCASCVSLFLHTSSLLKGWDRHCPCTYTWPERTACLPIGCNAAYNFPSQSHNAQQLIHSCR